MVQVGKYLSNYLRAAQIKETQILTIRSVMSERMGLGENAQKKLVVYFLELEQGLPLNKGNLKELVNRWGEESDDWIGKKIELKVTQTEYQGKEVLGMRIKIIE